MPIYAHYGVQHTWLVDPLARTHEAFENQEGAWERTGSFRDNDPVCTAPFQAITIALDDLWA